MMDEESNIDGILLGSLPLKSQFRAMHQREKKTGSFHSANEKRNFAESHKFTWSTDSMDQSPFPQGASEGSSPRAACWPTGALLVGTLHLARNRLISLCSATANDTQ